MLSEKLLLPFLATVAASLTVLFIQFNTRRVSETKKKVYAISYVYHHIYKLLFSELTVLKATITPHITAMEEIFEGDTDMLTKMFHLDEFDILKAPSPSMNHLPKEYLLLIGYDNINLSSTYETLQYLESSDLERQELNSFVAKNLKSIAYFNSLSAEEQKGVLMEYCDRLVRIEHATKRKIYFILYVMEPIFAKYSKSYQFWLYSTKNIKSERKRIREMLNHFSDYLPSTSFGEESLNGGIQNEIST